MKRIFLTFLCVLSLLISLFLPVYASEYSTAASTVLFHFPNPSNNNNFVFATEGYCTVFYPYFYNYDTIGFDGPYNNHYSGSIASVLQCYVSIGANNSLFFDFMNLSGANILIFYMTYRPDGTCFSQGLSFTVPSNSVYSKSIVYNSISNGYYASNMIIDDSLQLYPLANISFSDSLDYSSDFYQINSMLIDIQDGISLLASQDSSFYTYLEDFLHDFFLDASATTNDNPYFYNWRHYLSLISYMSTTEFNFYTEFWRWYNNYYIPMTGETNELLSDILDALVESDVSQPDIENQTEMESAVSQYGALENSIIDSQNEALEDLDDILSDWDSPLQGWYQRSAFAFIKWFFEHFLFQYYSLFFIIPLIFGVVVLVLGRRLQR